jgi:manganese transport protein
MADTHQTRPGDAATVQAMVRVLSTERPARRAGNVLPFLGPAFVAAVAYVDPGNYATNLQGGARFGYLLLWVVLLSNLMAMLVQTLSAKLGIATGKNLAELCRDEFPRWLVGPTWALMELVAIATDLAEFLGAALGFNLLFGISLPVAGVLTALVSFLLLGLSRYGFRPLELVITLFVGVIAASYLLELVLARPDLAAMTQGALRPRFAGKQSVYLASGILGATVMPHVIFLHSALTQGRMVTRDPGKLRRLLRFQVLDVVVAMSVAGLVNAAMLVMAAETFHKHGLVDVSALEEAHRTLEPLLGRAASTLFAVSLLASGLSSSAIGTLSGQIIMQGFLRRHIPVWLRRGVTVAPALAVIFSGYDPTAALVLSQVVLSFGLPFAVVPLVRFTSQTRLMGTLVNHRVTTVLAGLVAALVVGLNLWLVQQSLFSG